MEMDIDGVGGVSILAKAKVFRSGVHFPAFSFEKHAETEGFGKVRFQIFANVGSANQFLDGQAYEVFGGRTSPLHNLASLRT
jgi:mannan polymerase II complex ANP1 subunit